MIVLRADEDVGAGVVIRGEEDGGGGGFSLRAASLALEAFDKIGLLDAKVREVEEEVRVKTTRSLTEFMLCCLWKYYQSQVSV